MIVQGVSCQWLMWQKIDIKREWESKRKEVKKEGQKKIDSGVVKGLSIKIRSHINLLEPKGVHPIKKQEKKNGIDKENADKLEDSDERK